MHEGGALGEAWFIRKVPVEAGGEKRATWDGGDVAAAVAGGVQADVAPSRVVKGGESPRKREWEASSGLKESECAEKVEVDLQGSEAAAEVEDER